MHIVDWHPPRGIRTSLVFCHGVPGTTMHDDMFARLREAGLGVLRFRYRGAFGAPGDFTFAGCLDDIEAAVAHARKRTGGPVALVGYSAGGHYAARAVARNPRLVNALVLMGAATDLPAMWRRWEARGPDALGRYYADGGGHLVGDPARRHSEALEMRDGPQPVDLADTIAVPTLVLHGTRDTDVPIALAEGYAKRASRAQLVALDTDHEFAGAQEAAAREIERFLARLARL